MINPIDQNALYPIREVARLTGIKPITLRAWERRYDLIEPVRTESGHRLYTQEHIDFLHEALRLMDEGIPISRVKAVLSEPVIRKSDEPQSTEEGTSELINKISVTVGQFHIQNLERLLDRLFADYSLQAMLSPLAEIEQHLKKQTHSTTALSFWHTSLIRRLNVRLHSLQTQPILPSKRIFIQKANQTPDWVAKIVALFCFEQGYQPIQLDENVALESLIEVTKPLGFTTMIFIDFTGSATREWQLWFKHYSSLRTWVFGNNTLEEQSTPSVNCELRAWPQWFSPLQL